ncbi:PREDICTED: transport and Golgi organization 2 homolog [Camelina sativa]|uniref:Transport and Golgi organization 2 homolog n=1 Tax=Camelina sativa TaxID=90675 RepID=A0ABM0UIH5_CAMSA|nr:PREDICTED: transport and Golgi organization 2 homolog [Camelina sativa]
MGIVAFNWAEGGNNQLMLLMNRDNWGNRVISKASWNRNGQILSGRCKKNEGTWFGISKRGRVAFLVNTSLLLDRVKANSGSELYPLHFLEGDLSPQQFAEELKQHEQESNERLVYSLIVADMTSNSMVHIRKPEAYKSNVVIENVTFGVHTLSSYEGLDSTESPRDLLLSGLFSQMIVDLGNNQLPPLRDIAGKFMYDTEGERDAVFLETTDEHPSGNLDMQRYGTTSTTALVVKHTREVMFFERFMDTNGGWDKHDFNFNIE